MKKNIVTERLRLNPISINDSDFIIELVNTEGWKKYIGKRDIHDKSEADRYIQKYTDDKHTKIWTVKLKITNTPIGIITLLKREYLEHRDIGFAFLPEFFNKGFAFEAAKSVLDELQKNNDEIHLQATTVPENIRSVRLLKKLGLKFDKEIEVENNKLCVYIVTFSDEIHSR